jgi:hypothetical protein
MKKLPEWTSGKRWTICRDANLLDEATIPVMNKTDVYQIGYFLWQIATWNNPSGCYFDNLLSLVETAGAPAYLARVIQAC